MQFLPKTIFLIDGLGALVTAMMLGIVLPLLPDWFNMPHCVLYMLGGIAIAFAIYSLTCSQIIKKKWKPFLGGIIVANSLYLFLSVWCLWYLYKMLTIFDLTYFLLEFVIVSILIFVEIKIWRQL